MSGTSLARLEKLIRDIYAWEDEEEMDLDATEELILDIKQCLESVVDQES